jgi:excisionase family DNA binding protein
MTDSNPYFGQVALSIGEVARQTGVTPATVRNWDKAGKIASFRTVGNQRRFPIAEVIRIRAERDAA